MSTPTAERSLAREPASPEEGGARVEVAAEEVESRARFSRLYWASVPLLAVAAYVTALRIGFIADDFVLIYEPWRRGFDLGLLAPNPTPYWRFYRPVGWLLTWLLGWAVWGFNPLPYHVLGLLLHAGVSLALGLWLAALTSWRWLGRLAGALFAVYPLHAEAVGWVSAQWDLWAALFGLLSLLTFTLWWRAGRGGWGLYVGSVILYGLGLFSKESLFAFVPVYAVSAWVATPHVSRAAWSRLALSLLPFVGVVALFVAVRVSTWGNLGNYPWARTDYQNFFWDNLISHGRILLAPLNPAVLGGAAAQAAGAMASVGILLGLVLYGRERRRLLLLAGVWVALALAPVLNLPIRADNFENTRFLYLPSVGYCVGVAVLVHGALASVGGRGRKGMALAVVGVVGLLAVGACWVQLRNWHTATVQTQAILEETRRLIPPQPNPVPRSMVWYVDGLPATYRGAYVAVSGFERMRFFDAGDEPEIKSAPRAEEAPLNAEPRSAFALRYYYDEALNRFRVNYAAGLTGDSPPPSGESAGSNLKVWDFRECSPDMLRIWRIVGATISCERGNGLMLEEPSDDAQMLSPSVDLGAGSDARFVRVRVSVSYTPLEGAPPVVGQLFWRGADQGWAEERSRVMPLRLDGEPNVYWAFLPAAEFGGVTRLRFDPANGGVAATVRWMAVDVVR